MSLNRPTWLRTPLAGLDLGIGPGSWIQSDLPGSGVRAQFLKSKTVEVQTAPAETRRSDPKARALFDEVSKAYKALSSYTDEGQFVMAMTANGKPQKQAVPFKVTLVRPNKVDIDTGLVRLTSDGTTLTTSMIPLKRYMTAPAPQKIDVDMLREGSIWIAALFGGPGDVLGDVRSAQSADRTGSFNAAIAQIGGSLQLTGQNGPKADGANTGNAALLIDLRQGRGWYSSPPSIPQPSCSRASI